MILTSVVNVGLDFLMILVFRMGVRGAALATVLSQLVSVGLCAWYAIRKYSLFRLKKEDWHSSGRFLWEHLRIGLPMAFQFSITAIGCLVNQAVLNTLGPVAIATYAAANKAEQFLSQTFVSVGYATAAYTSQNYGAGDMTRIKQGIRISVAIEIILAVVSCVLVLTAGTFFVGLFVGSDVTPEMMQDILEYARIFFLIDGPGYLLLALLFVFRNALQGVGKSIGTVYGGLAELVMRVVAALVLVRVLGFMGVCIANPAAWGGAMIVQLLLFFYYFRKVCKPSPEKPNEEQPIGSDCG